MFCPPKCRPFDVSFRICVWLLCDSEGVSEKSLLPVIDGTHVYTVCSFLSHTKPVFQPLNKCEMSVSPGLYPSPSPSLPSLSPSRRPSDADIKSAAERFPQSLRPSHTDGRQPLSPPLSLSQSPPPSPPSAAVAADMAAALRGGGGGSRSPPRAASDARAAAAFGSPEYGDGDHQHEHGAGQGHGDCDSDRDIDYDSDSEGRGDSVGAGSGDSFIPRVASPATSAAVHTPAALGSTSPASGAYLSSYLSPSLSPSLSPYVPAAASAAAAAAAASKQLQVDELRASVARLEQERNAIAREHDAVLRRCLTAEGKHKLLEARAEQLQAALDAAREEAASAAATDAALQQLQDMVQYQGGVDDNLEAGIDATHRRLDDLVAQLAKAHSEVSAANDAQAAAEQHTRAVQRDMDATSAQLDDALDGLSAAKLRCSELDS